MRSRDPAGTPAGGGTIGLLMRPRQFEEGTVLRQTEAVWVIPSATLATIPEAGLDT